jgi:hypothetical protein
MYLKIQCFNNLTRKKIAIAIFIDFSFGLYNISIVFGETFWGVVDEPGYSLRIKAANL